MLLGELFGAESKSQVYGHVHTFLQRNDLNLRMFLFLKSDVIRLVKL